VRRTVRRAHEPEVEDTLPSRNVRARTDDRAAGGNGRQSRPSRRGPSPRAEPSAAPRSCRDGCRPRARIAPMRRIPRPPRTAANGSRSPGRARLHRAPALFGGRSRFRSVGKEQDMKRLHDVAVRMRPRVPRRSMARRAAPRGAAHRPRPTGPDDRRAGFSKPGEGPRIPARNPSCRPRAIWPAQAAAAADDFPLDAPRRRTPRPRLPMAPRRHHAKRQGTDDRTHPQAGPPISAAPPDLGPGAR
jgi:hypothetical protein